MESIPEHFKPFMEKMKQSLPKATTKQIVNVLQLIFLMSGYEVVHKDKFWYLGVKDEKQNFERMVERFLSNTEEYGRFIKLYSEDKGNIDWYAF